jgi:hypothetical protein
MRHTPTLLLLVLTASTAYGQTPPARPEVKELLREALTLQATAPVELPRLPESVSEPVRVAAPRETRAPAPSTQPSGQVIERAGRMADRLPVSVPGEPTRLGAATGSAAADGQAATSRAQAEEVRQQLPPRPGTPGGPPTSPPPSPPVTPPTVPPGSPSR